MKCHTDLTVLVRNSNKYRQIRAIYFFAGGGGGGGARVFSCLCDSLFLSSVNCDFLKNHSVNHD